MEKITDYLIKPTVKRKGIVKAWEEVIMLPTYEIGEEEKNPIFLEKRVYQGSSGSVYPYPVVEKITDEKVDKSYKALFLENYYLKIMVLPELGGRVQMAYDKIRKRHFIYYNQVIKPALVGLTGPWISGGIEFNWPQHHRPSTFLPIEYRIEKNKDGSVTVWCNEVERMFRTKGMQGFTLYPDKAYLEIKVQIYNRTAFPQTFLWWANPAVVVNDAYKSVFPPDVHAVYDHGKRDVSTFPIATGVYYKQDYSAGVDISRYNTIPVPTSYMAVASKYDFVGGYEDEVEAGVLHVANHHYSTGKKQWTWGNGDFGQAWDRNLTDEDGPYIELMTGVYTDNQPDFSWLQPYEEKSWKQYFMPYAKVGYVKNASKDIILNLEMKNDRAEITLYATSDLKNLEIKLTDKSKKDAIIYKKKFNISPENPIELKEIPLKGTAEKDVLLEIHDKDKKVILSFTPEKAGEKPVPEPAKPALQPKDVKNNEQLFLTGHHLEQYRHATYDPMDYYNEALARDEGDVRCNNAIGLLLVRRGQFAKAQPYFEKAIETITERNPNPYDGEPYYNLGWCLLLQGKPEEAYPHFYKATWNSAWQDSSYYSIAQIDLANGNLDLALENVERSLVKNWHNHKARQLKATILRKMGEIPKALRWVEDSLEIDGFNVGCLFEKYLLTKNRKDINQVKNILNNNPHTFIEYALDFIHCGCYDEAIRLLTYFENPKSNPMISYTIAYAYSLSGNQKRAKDFMKKAMTANPERIFPNRVEDVNILKNAIELMPNDAKAYYFLGNFWYAKRQYDEAVSCWEKSISIDEKFPTALRNLALAYYNKLDKKAEARELLEKAFALDKGDARILMELDQMYKKMNMSPKFRLDFLDKNFQSVEKRDDMLVEYITLQNQLDNYEKAMELTAKYKFHPWEGGEGKITSQYVISRMQLAMRAINDGNFAKALELLNETNQYPYNLGEGKLINAKENDIDYVKGLAYKGTGNAEGAKQRFLKATQGDNEPYQAFFYNDQSPDKILYQGLAWRELGDEAKAKELFKKLIAHGEKHMNDNCKIDFFAVSLPDLAIWEDDLNVRNKIHCHYVIGLGYFGLNDKKKASEHLDKVLELDVNHQGAQIHKTMI